MERVWGLCCLPCLFVKLLAYFHYYVIVFNPFSFIRSLIFPPTRTVTLLHNGHFNLLHAAAHYFSMSYIALF